MFKLQSLLETKEDGKKTGPMAPVMAANEFTRQIRELFGANIGTKALYRVIFDDPKVHNHYDGKKRDKWLTSSGTLVMLDRNSTGIFMFVDLGDEIAPAAFQVEQGDEVMFPEIYANCGFLESLNENEIAAIFDAVRKDFEDENSK